MKKVACCSMAALFSCAAVAKEIAVASDSYVLTAEDVATGPIVKTGAGELVINSSLEGLTDVIQIEGGTVRVTGANTTVTQNKYSGSWLNPYWPWKDGTLIIENGATVTTDTSLFEQGNNRSEVNLRKIFVTSGATLNFTASQINLGSYNDGGRLGNVENAKNQAYLCVDAGSLVFAGKMVVGNNMGTQNGKHAFLEIVNGATVSGGRLEVGNRSAQAYDYLVVDSSEINLTDGIYIDPSNKEWSHVRLLFKNCTVTLNKFGANRPSQQNDRAVKFDGATFKPTAASTSFFSLDNVTAYNHLLSGGLIIDTAYDVALDAKFDGVGGIVKRGTGKLTLDIENDYTGATVVEAGTAVITKGLVGNLEVKSGATAELTAVEACPLPKVTLAAGATLVIHEIGQTITAAENYEGATLRVTAADYPLATPLLYSLDEAFLSWAAAALGEQVQISEGHEFTVENGAVVIKESGAGAKKTAVWTGAGASGNWSVLENWSDAGRVNQGDALLFNTAANTATLNDLGDFTVESVCFTETAGAFTIGGSVTLSVIDGVRNDSENAQTFALPVAVPNSTFSVAAVGAVVFKNGLAAPESGAEVTKTGAGTWTVAQPGANLKLDLREGAVVATGVDADAAIFSSEVDAIRVNGTLDAGGGTVTINANAEGCLSAGSVLRNGTFVYNRTGAETALPWEQGNVTVDHAVFNTAELFKVGGDRIYTAIPRSLTLVNGAAVNVSKSPAYIVSRNDGDGLSENGQQVNTTPVSVVMDASTLNLPQITWLGAKDEYAAARNGRLCLNNGSFLTGGELNLGYRAGRSWLAVTNSVLSFKTIQICPKSYNGYYSNGSWITFDHSVVTNNSLIVKKSTSDSNPQSVTFNAATLVPTSDSTTFINKPDYATKGTVEILEGGLVIDSNGHVIGISETTDLIGAGGLTKRGNGTLAIASANTYTGVTSVEGGALALTGSLAGALEVGAEGALAVVLTSTGESEPGQAASVCFVEGSRILFDSESCGESEVFPFLTVTGEVVGTPTVEASGRGHGKWVFKATCRNGVTTCSVVRRKGFTISFR